MRGDRVFRPQRAGIMARPQPVGTPNVPPMGVRGFSPLPSAAYSCYDPCPDGSSQQVPEYVPYYFSPFYKRVRVPGIIKGVDSLLNACVPEFKGGYCKTWWFVKAMGWDVLMNTLDPDAPALPAEVEPTGIPYSALKLEIVGTEYGRYKATFRFDIGTRIDISVGAFQRIDGYVLIPDFQRYLENGGVTTDTAPYNLQDWRAKSLVAPSAVGVEALGGFRNGRFTQSLLFDPTAVPTPQTSQTMDLPPASKQVVVWTDNPALAPPTLSFLTETGLPVAVVVPTLGEPIDIPDNAARVTVTQDGGVAVLQVATLIFHLDV